MNVLEKLIALRPQVKQLREANQVVQDDRRKVENLEAELKQKNKEYYDQLSEAEAAILTDIEAIAKYLEQRSLENGNRNFYNIFRLKHYTRIPDFDFAAVIDSLVQMVKEKKSDPEVLKIRKDSISDVIQFLADHDQDKWLEPVPTKMNKHLTDEQLEVLGLQREPYATMSNKGQVGPWLHTIDAVELPKTITLEFE